MFYARINKLKAFGNREGFPELPGKGASRFWMRKPERIYRSRPKTAGKNYNGTTYFFIAVS
jgi:hypothetical protein